MTDKSIASQPLLKPELSTRTYVWGLLRPQSFWLALSFFLGALSAGLQVGLSKYVQTFIDVGLLTKNGKNILFLSGILVLVISLDGLLDFFHRFLMRMSVERSVHELRQRIFKRILILSERAAYKINSGKALTHIISDTSSFGIGMTQATDVVREPLMILFLIAYMLSLNAKLTLLCFLAIAIVPLIGGRLARSSRRNHTRYQESIEKISSHALEAVRGRRTALAFGRQRELQLEFAAKSNQAYQFLLRLARAEEGVNPITKIITSLVGALLLGFAGMLVTKGEMSLGEVTAFLLSAGRLQGPLKLLNQANVRIQQLIATATRLKNFLTEPLDDISLQQESMIGAESIASNFSKEPFQTLRFENVSFHYPKRESEDTSGKVTPALQSIDFSLERGKKIALVGKSGSGKTTLSLLAMRLMDPESGSIFLNDKKATHWDLQQYRNHFSYVSQDVFLFQRSLRENFLFSKPDATDAEIFQALEQAAISEFVNNLPQGLDTQIGEMGSTLSGGEKQRLAIARAFLRDAPVLILDEATSQLDSFSEAIVQKSLLSLIQNRSVILIAHRLSTVKEADQVLVFEQGRIIERGAPQELLAQQNGAFSALWKTQFQESSH